MAIYKTAVQKPVTTALIFVAVIVMGIYSYIGLPIDQFPEMDPPYATVLITYPGTSASEMETNVTKVLENSLNSVDHLKEMTSQSKDNMSMVTLEFEWGSNMDEATNDIRSYVDMAKDNLPDGVSNPVIFKMSTSMIPVIQYAFTADESYPALDKLLDDEIVPRLNRVDGIGNLTVVGAPERRVYVYCDQKKLDAYGLTVENVGQTIGASNLNVSSGTVKMPTEQYTMEVRAEFAESSEINDLVLKTLPTGQQVRICDVAQVKDTIKELSLDEKTNARDCARILVTKQTGGNTIQICRDVRKEMEEIKRNLPADVKVDMIYDSSENIQNSIDSLKESIGYALLFVVLVVLFFLGRWRATLIIALTIPISLIVAFIYLGASGSSLNIISLCSLTIAIGMVVDDAIVVLENITKHVERGENPREAAIYATNEVWVSVIATTLVIVAVFVPMTFLNGMAGILFKQLGWIVTIVCCTSTAIAISLTPMMASKLLKPRQVHVDENGDLVDDDKNKSTWYDRHVVKMLDRVDDLYAKTLSWCLGHKKSTFGILFVFFAASLFPMFMGWIGTDFMAQQDSGRLQATIKLQRGTRIETTLQTARTLEDEFRAVAPEIELISTSAGNNDEAGIGAIFSSTMNNTISMIIRCNKKWDRDRSIWDIAEALRGVVRQHPEVIDYNIGLMQMGGMGSNSVDIEIYGYDFDKTSELAERVQYLCNHEVAGARDATISRDDEQPELKIEVDKVKAARLGLTAQTIGVYLRDRVTGMNAGFLKDEGSEYNILVRLQENDRDSYEDILNLTIPTGVGTFVKLSEVCSIGEYWAPPTIERKTRQRYVKVSVTPYNTSLGELVKEIEAKVMPQLDIPQGVTIEMGGSYEDQQENFGKMGLLGALIILLVYIVMASQFESLKKPFIIMFTIPFALSGVLLALWMTQRSLDMIGALGIVMLVGIVVKNGIVLIDYIDLLRERGEELNKAIVAAGRSRVRPIMMTALTTILGMVPMAMSNGEGAEMWQPMGIVVIGGLLVSTLLTFFVVPTLYGAMSRHGERDRDAEARKNFIFLNIKLKKEKK